MKKKPPAKAQGLKVELRQAAELKPQADSFYELAGVVLLTDRITSEKDNYGRGDRRDPAGRPRHAMDRRRRGARSFSSTTLPVGGARS